MNKYKEEFINAGIANYNNEGLQTEKQRISANYKANRSVAVQRFKALDSLEHHAAFMRWKSIESLDKHLIAFEANFHKQGGKVLWSRHRDDAAYEFKKLFGNKTLNLWHDKSNMMHELQIDNLLSGFPDITVDDRIQHGLDVALVEADFFTAEPASAVLLNRYENIYRLTAQVPKLVVLIHIDKILPTLNELSLMALLKTIYTDPGLQKPSFKLILKPHLSDPIKTPQEVYVMIIDNGRSNLLADRVMRQANRCIDCHACNHVCPVYQTTGSLPNINPHSFSSVIRSIEKPFVSQNNQNHYLAYNSTLCGACTQICPVKIDLNQLIIHLRGKLKNENGQQNDSLFFYLWKQVMIKRDRFGFAKRLQKKLLYENLYEKIWGQKNDMPPLAEKSFNEQMQDKMNGK